MKTMVKIILGLVAGSIVLCLVAAVAGFSLFGLGGRVLARSMETNPEKIASVGSSIADYTLPEGFKSAFATELMDFTVAGYNGSDGHSHIFLMQLPQSLTLDETTIQRQMQQAVPADQYSRPERMVVVDHLVANIRGEMVPVVVSEGTNHDGQAYRELNALFQGKNGQALINISAPTDSWDQTMVDEFLASIR
jgi:hypothetical protein